MRSRVHSLWLLVDHCVLINWDRILVRAVKGLISRAGMVSICPLLWQRDVKLQQTTASYYNTAILCLIIIYLLSFVWWKQFTKLCMVKWYMYIYYVYKSSATNLYYFPRQLLLSGKTLRTIISVILAFIIILNTKDGRRRIKGAGNKVKNDLLSRFQVIILKLIMWKRKNFDKHKAVSIKMSYTSLLEVQRPTF